MKKIYCFVGALILSAFAFAQQPETYGQYELEQKEISDQYELELKQEQPSPLEEVTPALEQEQASPEIISSYKETCTTWAQDDGIEAENLNNYLLDCVNQELSYGGYASVESI